MLLCYPCLMLSFILVFLSGSKSVHGFFLSFLLYLYCCWEIKLSRGGGLGPIKMLNPTTLLYLSLERVWIFNVTCHGLFHVQWFEVRGDCTFVCFVDIGGIVDHHCLNFLFIMQGLLWTCRWQIIWQPN